MPRGPSFASRPSLRASMSFKTFPASSPSSVVSRMRTISRSMGITSLLERRCLRTRCGRRPWGDSTTRGANALWGNASNYGFDLRFIARNLQINKRGGEYATPRPVGWSQARHCGAHASLAWGREVCRRFMAVCGQTFVPIALGKGAHFPCGRLAPEKPSHIRPYCYSS